jgi:SAM-dependent methyltransferase
LLFAQTNTKGNLIFLLDYFVMRGAISRISQSWPLDLLENRKLNDFQKPMHKLNFKAVSLILKSRDFFYPPYKVLDEVRIRPNDYVLDFGCGPGSYSIAVAQRLETGKVFALDIHPLALESVSHAAHKKRLTSVKTILSDCYTGLPSNSIDVILLYYIYNDLKNSDSVLHELHRVLKPQGILSFSEYNLNKISRDLEKKDLFQLYKKGEITHTFLKIP